MKLKIIILLLSLLPTTAMAVTGKYDKIQSASGLTLDGGQLFFSINGVNKAGIRTSGAFNVSGAASDPGSAVAGDLFYRTDLGAFRYFNGSTWNDFASSGGGGSTKRATNSVSSSFVIPSLVKDYLLLANSGAGSFNVTLPDPVESDGFCADIKNVGSPTHTVSVISTQLIDGLTGDTLNTTNESRHYCATAGSWSIF